MLSGHQRFVKQKRLPEINVPIYYSALPDMAHSV